MFKTLWFIWNSLSKMKLAPMLTEIFVFFARLLGIHKRYIILRNHVEQNHSCGENVSLLPLISYICRWFTLFRACICGCFAVFINFDSCIFNFWWHITRCTTVSHHYSIAVFAIDAFWYTKINNFDYKLIRLLIFLY